MFFGREKELALIRSLLAMDNGSMMIYGKRKVGKTTLIQKALSEHSDKFVYFECLKSSMEDNIKLFTAEIVREKVLPIAIKFESLIDLFTYLNTLPQKLNIVIDEYPYLKAFNQSAEVDSVFQNIIDNRLSNIRLFISGSHISMMKDLLEEGNALYGRFTSVICLKELDYRTASEFYRDKSAYDKVAFFSIFGGSPFVNRSINPKLSLKENVINTILNPSSSIYNYADNLLLSDFSQANNMERIFYALANGKKKYTEIQSILQLNSNGILSKQMKVVLAMDLVSKVAPINKLNDAKKTCYEISDNLLRFYYAFVYGKKSALQMIGAEAFYEEYIEPVLTTYISHRFEEICRSYFSLQAEKRKLTGVLNIGTYYYDDPKNRKNGEFDVVLERRDCFDVYEVKYLSSPLTKRQMQAEVAQISEIEEIQIGTIGFISVNGFEETVI